MELHKYLENKKKGVSQQRRGWSWQGRSSEEGQEMAGWGDSRRSGLAALTLRALLGGPSFTNSPRGLTHFHSSRLFKTIGFAFDAIY